MPSTTSLTRLTPYALVVIVMGAVCLLGFPRPMIDDLFFIGAGINLSQFGVFSNPMLERQHFPSELYFVHPPLHSYVIAGWMNTLGINTFSLLAFQAVCYTFICWATIKILRKYQAPRLIEWLPLLGVITAFISLGLRPEPLSVALTMTGLALLECNGKRSATIFFGFLLIFLGGSAASRLSFFSGALALASFVRLSKDGIPWTRLCGLAGCAMILVILGIAWMIGFQFTEFFKTYLFHAAGRVDGDKIGLFFRFTSSLLGISQWPLLFFWFFSLPLLWHLRSKNPDLVRLGLYSSAAFLALAGIGGLGHGAIWYVVFILFVLATAYTRQAGPRISAVSQAVLTCILVVACGRYLVELTGMATGNIKSEKIRHKQTSFRKPTPDHPLLIDSATARYVFDYRLPKKVLDWSFAAPFPYTLATDTTLRPEDVYLLGPSSVDTLHKSNQIEISTPKWAPLRQIKWSFNRNPELTYIIEAKDCMIPSPAKPDN